MIVSTFLVDAFNRYNNRETNLSSNYKAFRKGYVNTIREFNALCNIGEIVFRQGEENIETFLEEMESVSLEVHKLVGADTGFYLVGSLICEVECLANRLRKIELNGDKYSYGELMDKGVEIYEANIRT